MLQENVHRTHFIRHPVHFEIDTKQNDIVMNESSFVWVNFLLLLFADLFGYEMRISDNNSQIFKLKKTVQYFSTSFRR